MVVERAATAWGPRSTAGIKASRTASAHASLRSMRWTLTRALPLTPMTAQEPPSSPLAIGAYSQNAHPSCMSCNSGSSKSIRPV